MVVDKINTYLSSKNLTIDEAVRLEVEKLAGFSFKRQFMAQEEDTSNGKLRLSGCGKCPRQLSYGFHGIEKSGKEIDSRGKIVFFMGDLVELMVTSIARLAGVKIYATGLNQTSVSIDVKGNQIEGHPDGLVIDNGINLAEFKSMTSFAYSRFEEGDIEYSYLAQVNIYMHGLGISKCAFVAVNKDNGVLGEIIVVKDKRIIEESINNMATVLSSTPDKLPDARFDKDEKGFYPWQCLYCSWWKVCKPKAEKVLVRDRYKLMERK